MSDFSDFSALAAAVDANGGLLVCTMQQLRELAGYSKLGKYVVQEIIDKLDRNGLSFFHGEEGVAVDELPTYQHQEIRVFKRGTSLAKLIEAVKRPSARGDELLRETGQGDADAILNQIRALVCR